MLQAEVAGFYAGSAAPVVSHLLGLSAHQEGRETLLRIAKHELRAAGVMVGLPLRGLRQRGARVSSRLEWEGGNGTSLHQP